MTPPAVFLRLFTAGLSADVRGLTQARDACAAHAARTAASLSAEDVARILHRAEVASAGPWHPRFTDDEHFMCASYVGTHAGPDSHDHKRGMAVGDEGQEPPENVIAITLLQAPTLAVAGDDRWDENAEFIAHARTDVPRLCASHERMRAALDALILWTTNELGAPHYGEAGDDGRCAPQAGCPVCDGRRARDGVTA